MTSGLNILIADRSAQQTVLLAQYLMSMQHQVETCDNSIEAVQAIKKRLAQRAPYDACILHARLPGMAANDLVERLESMQFADRLALIVPVDGLVPGEEILLRNHGCRHFLHAPINLNAVGDVLQALHQPQKTEDVPFFGTARINRNASSPQSSSGTSSYAANKSNELDDDPFSQADRQASQQSSDYFRRPHSASHRRDRGGVSNQAPSTPMVDPAPEPPAQPLSTVYHRQTSSTHRIRRSVTGSYQSNPAEETASAYHHQYHQQVRCAHCMQVFSVPRRTEEFTTVCVHCGQLNRILPA